jgi:hypothetical protein
MAIGLKVVNSKGYHTIASNSTAVQSLNKLHKSAGAGQSVTYWRGNDGAGSGFRQIGADDDGH